MLATVLSSYLALNLLLVLAWAILAVGSFALRKTNKPLRSSALLRLHYFALPLLLACTLATPLFPGVNFRPAARVWAANSFRTFNHEYKQAEGNGFLSLRNVPQISSVETDKIIWVGSGLALLLLFSLSFRISMDLKTLFRIRRRSFLVKKVGGISLTTNDEITVPFTYWLPGNLTVVLPTNLLGNPVDYNIAVTHELQHHRQRDTSWIYAIWLLRTVCALNPAAHLWARWMMETQEFACDETLVDRKKVDSQAYARCLVTVAQSANRQNFIPACATGLIFLAERNLLRRRIECMHNVNKISKGKSTTLALGIMLLVSLGASAYAAKGLVQDRRVTLSQAQAMQAVAQKNSTIPIEINEPVLRQLNRLLGTADGRAYMRASLQRMESHKRMVEESIDHYGAAPELLALPLSESGYQNLEQAKSGNQSAGIWQFIPGTARHFGLRVDAQVDERLNVEKETDAGIRYLSANFLLFNDWRLSLMAYNMGERGLQNAIEKTGIRDPWKLIKLGHEGDHDYLASFMAVLIIMKNPGSLE